MATHEKREYLRLTLESLTAQTFHNFELVLCDDGTMGGVQDVVSPFTDTLNIILITQVNKGRAAARNAALEHASGDLVIFIDDDRMADPDFVATHVAAADLTSYGNIGWKRRAVTWWRPGELPLSEPDLLWVARKIGDHERLQEDFWFLQPGAISVDTVAALASVDRGDEPDNYHSVVEKYGISLAGFRFGWALATTANLAVPLAAVKEVGGFDPDFSGWGMEDTDLSYRLNRLGLKFAVLPDAINYHQVHPLMSPDPIVAQRLMRAQLMRNLDHFCKRHPNLDAYLFRRRWEHAMTLIEANELLEQLESHSRGGLRDELISLYATR